MRVNTEKMEKVTFNGKEIAFGKTHKNEFGEWVIKCYVDGIYSEDLTVYENSKDDAETTKEAILETYKMADQWTDVEMEDIE